MARLLVNIDHVATLRNARGEGSPDVVEAALVCEDAGAKGIVFHLREDRRHIRDSDLVALKQAILGDLDFEMAATTEMVDICCRLKPFLATLVPEKREELTTEGGLDVVRHFSWLSEKIVPNLSQTGIDVSVFIEPATEQIEAAAALKVQAVEFHTGTYAHAYRRGEFASALEALQRGAVTARKFGLKVNAGHGLDHRNIGPLLSTVPHLEDISIGHAIIADALFRGLATSVREMAAIIDRYVL